LSASFTALSRAVRASIGQPHRYAHSVRVARLADRLAQRHGEDAALARRAGMLHDVARLYDVARLLAECERRSLPVDGFERRHPIVLHARLGAELARDDFGERDERVLQAIRRHTLAAPGMTRLDAILYLADGLEPGRNFPERAGLEARAFADLDDAMRAVLASSIVYLRGRGLEAAPQTLAALETYTLAERSSLSA
jgi:predicted HD superfamily hydrolase involved in NAD metabolism